MNTETLPSVPPVAPPLEDGGHGVNGHAVRPLPAVFAPLPADEAAELDKCEAMILRGLQTFLEVGMALMTIREHRLYRAQHATFDDYLAERWDFGSRQAQRLMAAAGIVENIKAERARSAHATPLPTSESQVRPLAGLSAAEQFSVWDEAVCTAPGGWPTAKYVQRIVEGRQMARGGVSRPAVVEARPGGTREEQEREKTIEAIRAVRALVDEIRTPGSAAAATVFVMVGHLEEFKDELDRLEAMQKAHGQGACARPKGNQR